ncbi:hypothetical protein BMS3Abin15_00908 [bacterium BMS3Abin15]|nr:hypothetical protein BMS3Abin15_00908 [bacterium BMS3Abin15]
MFLLLIMVVFFTGCATVGKNDNVEISKGEVGARTINAISGCMLVGLPAAILAGVFGGDPVKAGAIGCAGGGFIGATVSVTTDEYNRFKYCENNPDRGTCSAFLRGIAEKYQREQIRAEQKAYCDGLGSECRYGRRHRTRW